MAVWTLHAGIFILITTTTTVQSTNYIAPQVVYQKLEHALITDSKVRYLMEHTFFPSQGLSRDIVFIRVNVTVDSIQPESCDGFSHLRDTPNNFSYYQEFQWSVSSSLNLIPIDQLLILDNLISRSIQVTAEHHVFLPVALSIDTLPCNTSENDLLEALMQLLPWVKSYARRNEPTDEEDRGYVSISYNNFVTGSFKGSGRYSHFCRVSLLCAFVFLNILTPILLARLVSFYYAKMRAKVSNGDFMRYFYWALACMTFLINVVYSTSSLINQFIHNVPAITSCIIQLTNRKCSIPSDTSVYYDEVLTLVAKFTIIPVAVFTELLISVYTVKNNYNIRRKYVGCRCSSLKHYMLFSVHIIALWNILTALQIFTMTFIALCVLLLIHPQVVIMYIITLLLLTVGLTLIVAYMLYQCRKPTRKFQSNAKCCGSMCLYLVVITATTGLIGILIVLYELMLLVQVQIETGVKGIVLSLFPSLPLSALGWYMKRRSQRTSETDLDGKMLQLTPKEGPSCMTQKTVKSDNGDSLLLPL